MEDTYVDLELRRLSDFLDVHFDLCQDLLESYHKPLSSHWGVMFRESRSTPGIG